MDTGATNTGGVIRTTCPTGRWGAVPEKLLEDERLSLDSRLVAAWLATRPEGWTIVISALRQRLKIGKDKWLRIAQELVAAGYVTRRKMSGQSRGRFEWDIVFTPLPTATDATKSPTPTIPAATGQYDIETLIDATIRARQSDDPPKSPLGWAKWARQKAAQGELFHLEPGRRLIESEKQQAAAEARRQRALVTRPPNDPNAFARGKTVLDKVRNKHQKIQPRDTG